MAQYRRKQVVAGGGVRDSEVPRRRHQSTMVNDASKKHRVPQWSNTVREDALQAAMELPSSVLLAQGFRRLLNSDEPLYDVMEKEQKRQLQREFLKELDLIQSKDSHRSSGAVRLPPSPPATPKPQRVKPVKQSEGLDKRFCECCRARCV